MFEKVNPAHPDKIADRIAGAIVDYAYRTEADPKIAVEVLVGHGECFIIAETSVSIPDIVVSQIVDRIAGRMNVLYREYPQDKELAKNQKKNCVAVITEFSAECLLQRNKKYYPTLQETFTESMNLTGNIFSILTKRSLLFAKAT